MFYHGDDFTDQNVMQRNGDPMDLSFEGLEIQKWNISADRAQRVDEKNEIICLLIIFTSRVIVITMSKMAHFLYFLLITAKNQSHFGQNILSTSERSYSVLSENPMNSWIPSYH